MKASRLVATLAAVGVLGLLLIGSGGAAACATTSGPPTYTTLLTIPLVDAIAANSTMVFAQGVTDCSEIWAILPNGTSYLFATVPVSDSACDEGSLALAPAPATCTGQGGWNAVVFQAPHAKGSNGNGGQGGHHKKGGCCSGQRSGDILYDVVEGQLFEITGGGSVVTEIASFPISDKASENLGLAYDQVGDFGHDLIVTSSDGGKVWLVNATDGVALLAKLGTYIGGPAVAPTSFGPYGGDVVVAEKNLGTVVAIAPNGTVASVANWSKANAVTFPTLGGGGNGGGCHGGCTFGPQRFALFVANYSSGAVEAFPASELQGDHGLGFVAGGLDQGIGTFGADGSTSYFAQNTERLSDIASVVCFPPHGQGGGGGW